MDLSYIQLSDYSYHLPDERIARYPVDPRDSSKLLVYKEGQIEHDNFHNLVNYLPEHSFLVFNDTKVIPARIYFRKSTGAIIEVFLLTPVAPSQRLHDAMQTTEKCVWECMIGNKKRLKEGESYELRIDSALQVNISLVDADKNRVEFSWKTSSEPVPFVEVLRCLGQIPLPPYLKRATEQKDLDTYQTVYSKVEGAVAAPTAGLHFTNNVFEQLTQKDIRHDFVTLHVGAGTFLPVKVQNVVEHAMHTEQVVFSKALIENLLRNVESIVAVGTTSARSLESLYWFGVKLLEKESKVFFIEKLYPYQQRQLPTPSQSLDAVLSMMETAGIDELAGETQIFILPSYTFKICKGLITNYHQPESTLMLLVAAFVGDDWKAIYEAALKNDYRFLSYGDSSLLLPK